MKDQFKTLTRQYGKPICVALYAVTSALAVHKRPNAFLSLLGMHTAEYFLIGKKVAEAKGPDQEGAHEGRGPRPVPRLRLHVVAAPEGGGLSAPTPQKPGNIVSEKRKGRIP